MQQRTVLCPWSQFSATLGTCVIITLMYFGLFPQLAKRFGIELLQGPLQERSDMQTKELWAGSPQ